MCDFTGVCFFEKGNAQLCRKNLHKCGKFGIAIRDTDVAFQDIAAHVLEGVKRVGDLGAKVAYVGSSQQFYYSIGLRPYSSTTIWKKRIE